MTELALNCGAATDTGLVRERNEDRYWMDPARGAFLVVDGVGGQAAGERAAEIAVAAIRAGVGGTDHRLSWSVMPPAARQAIGGTGDRLGWSVMPPMARVREAIGGTDYRLSWSVMSPAARVREAIAAANNRIRMINPTGFLSTVAGSGIQGFAGDGGLATFADLDLPQTIAVDAANNIYIADTMNNRIRKLTFGSPCNPITGACTAIITTVAGSGSAGGTLGGFSGDGGPALNAQFNRPFGVALDSSGNLFVSDSYNQRIRKIDANGIVTTVAGAGASGFSGDGGPALSATFGFPTGLAVDAYGKIYVADTQNNVIRMLTPTSCASAFVLGAVSAGEFGAMTTVAPGSWMEIYGCDLTNVTASWNSQSAVPTSLDGTSVSIGGFSAYLSYVSPTQVNALVPSEIPAGPQTLYVFSSTGASNGFTATSNGFVINVAQLSPGLWAPPELKFGGKQYVGALFKDGSGLVLPPRSEERRVGK